MPEYFEMSKLVVYFGFGFCFVLLPLQSDSNIPLSATRKKFTITIIDTVLRKIMRFFEKKNNLLKKIRLKAFFFNYIYYINLVQHWPCTLIFLL